MRHVSHATDRRRVQAFDRRRLQVAALRDRLSTADRELVAVAFAEDQAIRAAVAVARYVRDQAEATDAADLARLRRRDLDRGYISEVESIFRACVLTRRATRGHTDDDDRTADPDPGAPDRVLSRVRRGLRQGEQPATGLPDVP